MSDKRPVRLTKVNANLLQMFRLSHALAECGIELSVTEEHAGRYEWLDQYFPGLSWTTSDDARRFSDIAIDHAAPTTCIAGVSRPLIFAHGVVDRCRTLWADERDIAISFAGLMTDQRAVALEPVTSAFGDRFVKVETNAGRVWPSKAWDEEYFAALGRSELVACPDGDFIWTYRFFESALCGAIPVIESEAADYAGFRFYRIGDDTSTMVWHEDWAEHNAALARELLTVPHNELRATIAPVSSAPSRSPSTGAASLLGKMKRRLTK
jgi:hypothetical protein